MPLANSLGDGVDLNINEQPDSVELHALPDGGGSLLEQAADFARKRAPDYGRLPRMTRIRVIA